MTKQTIALEKKYSEKWGIVCQSKTKDSFHLMGFGGYDGDCQACDTYGPVNDVGLCEVCSAKLDRDLIRKRDWDYSASAFGCPPERREALRAHVIAKYGAKPELLADKAPKRQCPKQNKKKRKSQIKA